MIPANGSQVTIAQVISGGLEDTTKKPLNFKQDKGASTPTFIAKGKDGQLYSVSLEGALITVNVAPRPNLKEDRKAGRPIPRDKADKIDKQLEKEKKRQEKLAAGEISAEDAAKEAQEDAKEEAKEAAEEDKAAAEEEEGTELAEKEPANQKPTGRRGR